MSDILTLVRSLTGARSHWAYDSGKSLCGRVDVGTITDVRVSMDLGAVFTRADINDLCTRCATSMRRASWAAEWLAHEEDTLRDDLANEQALARQDGLDADAVGVAHSAPDNDENATRSTTSTALLRQQLGRTLRTETTIPTVIDFSAPDNDYIEVVCIVDATTEGGTTDWGFADALIERSSHDLTNEERDCPPVCVHGKTSEQGCAEGICCTDPERVYPIAARENDERGEWIPTVPGRLTIHTAGERYVHTHPVLAPERITISLNLSAILENRAEGVALDGTDDRVQDLVFSAPGAQKIYDRLVSQIDVIRNSGKDVAVLIVSRDGRQRSVAFAENLALAYSVRATHHHLNAANEDPAAGVMLDLDCLARELVGMGIETEQDFLSALRKMTEENPE